MNPFYQFLWGFFGSAALEVVNLVSYYERLGRFPKRYQNKKFIFVRFVLATMGGGLAVAYMVDNPLLAINIGASAPALMFSLSQGLKAD